MRCPHCENSAHARTSVQLSPLFREVIYTCTNVNCGHVFVCGLEAIRTLSPSATPNPEVDLPLSRHVKKRELALQIQMSLLEEEAHESA